MYTFFTTLMPLMHGCRKRFLSVRCDHWKIAVARAERLENVRPRKSLPVLEKAKNRLVRGQVSTEHEEQLQICCRRKTGEHEPPDEEKRCRDERTQLQHFGADFHVMLEETSFVTHLHKYQPSLLYSWERNE